MLRDIRVSPSPNTRAVRFKLTRPAVRPVDVRDPDHQTQKLALAECMNELNLVCNYLRQLVTLLPLTHEEASELVAAHAPACVLSERAELVTDLITYQGSAQHFLGTCSSSALVLLYSILCSRVLVLQTRPSSGICGSLSQPSRSVSVRSLPDLFYLPLC